MQNPLSPSVEPAQVRRQKGLLRFLIICGVAALFYYYSWCRDGGRVFPMWMVTLPVLATAYYAAQLVGNWIIYLASFRRGAPPDIGTVADLTVDVYITAYKEPYEMIERTLGAACAMRGKHSTWLLDDGSDPKLAELAERLGAGYLTREERTHAKAGNMNAALPRTDGDILVIFDIDHVPNPDFLERSLGHFSDPDVGFVQVMLTFSNADESWVARAAAETCVDFYNPTSMGMDGLGSATLIGSNALIRRAALESVGGYRPGLAEDLATSIALHAAGWKSVYVAEPLAPGQAPADIPAWFTQQIKWARGVFEILLTDYPHYFAKLTWGQRLSYAVRMTYYWIGPVVGIHLIFTFAVLVFGDHIAQVNFARYLIHFLPLFLVSMMIRQVAISAWRHPSVKTNVLWRAVSLIYATWPLYVVAWGMALLRLPLGFRPTPKSPSGSVKPLWLLPQGTASLLLIGATFYGIFVGHAYFPPVYLGLAAFQCAPQVIVLWQALKGEQTRYVGRYSPATTEKS